MSDNSDDLDWFEKDENEILNDFQATKITNDRTAATPVAVEYIAGHTTLNDDYLQRQRLHAAAVDVSEKSNARKLQITKLRKISEMPALDAFLYVSTRDNNFFAAQIFPNDSQDRWLLYLNIINKIGELQLPYFHEEILMQIAEDAVLMEHFRYYVTNVLKKNIKNNKKNVDYFKTIENTIDQIQNLFLHIYQMKLLTSNCFKVLTHLHKLFNDHENSLVCQLVVVKEFQQHIALMLLTSKNDLLNVKNVVQMEKDNEIEIYPTLNELLLKDNNATSTNVITDTKQFVECNVENYINKQMNLLREDFVTPLRAVVMDLQNARNIDNYHLCLYEDVAIVLNSDFITSYRHELLFVDVLNEQRKLETENYELAQLQNEKKCGEIYKELKNLKVGTLLCLTTSREFENLIFATVTYTDRDIIRNGYVGIEIMRQFNIGNFYNKKMLMFETPAFFEPYGNVFNYLKNCCIRNFPMKRYIVDGELNVATPSYITPDTVYTYDDLKFKPNSNELPTALPNLNLNSTQFAAFGHALTKEFALIQGPPGTGKTHLSAQIVKTLMENAQKPIILLTYTNESLDKFLLKISTYTNEIIRFGSQSRNPEIEKYTIKKIANKELVNPLLKRLHYVIKEEFNDKFLILQTLYEQFDGTQESYEQILKAQTAVRYIGNKLEILRILFQYFIACKTHIIAMTTTYAAKKNFLFRLLKSSIVVFEEAAEILESHVIACLTPNIKHVIMIGDHLQLKPFTSTYQPNTMSLFERLIKQQIKLQVLTTQYRMRPIIADLLQPTIYEQLHNAKIVESYENVRIMKQNLYFYTHDNDETTQEYEPSIYNTYECVQIVNLAKNLILIGQYQPNDIVILSPYAKQVECIKETLHKFRKIQLDKISAQTVDSFQGLEANIVLLSLVRCNKIGQIGFLSQINRICVALSRAKYGLYIIGNINLLADNCKIWKQIKDKLNAQNAIGQQFPYENEEIDC